MKPPIKRTVWRDEIAVVINRQSKKSLIDFLSERHVAFKKIEDADTLTIGFCEGKNGIERVEHPEEEEAEETCIYLSDPDRKAWNILEDWYREIVV